MPTQPASGANAFELLHPRVQDLIRTRLGWRSLKPIQNAALRPVLAAQRDVLIIAGTASGKTEAAWMPMFSLLLGEGNHGLGVLAVSPLKALIDDQARRLVDYGRQLDLRVTGWHGDISHSRKLKVLDSPPDALLITPESLQGLLLRRPNELKRMLQTLRYILVDEVHAFAGTDRGHQLQSLLHQTENRLGRRIPRIALSATVSRPELVTEFLRPGQGSQAVVVRTAQASRSDVDVRVQGFVRRPAAINAREATQSTKADSDVRARDVAEGQRLDIAARIDHDTRGRRTLVFAGSRLAVEEMTALLRDESVTGTRRPHRYYAHHGSLSRELRKAAEEALRDTDDTVTVCTSTLELGIDLPHLDQVAQVDTCLSISGLRQRLGRSGRRQGTRPNLRIYISETDAPRPTDFDQRLRADLVQNVASVELIRADDWVEPTDVSPLGLSTLTHQTLALLSDPAGVTARQAWQILCGSGPWRRIDATQYADLLRSLASHGLIRQDARGRLALDEDGLRLTSGRSFLAVFATPAEYAVRHQGKELGSLPFSYPLSVGAALVMGGQTWRVEDVHPGGWTVDVVPHTSGLPPKFKGSFGRVHRRIRQAMRSVYEGDTAPEYLDETALQFLTEGRAGFWALGMAERQIIEQEGITLLALWTGDRELATLTRWMQMLRPGLVVDPTNIGLVIKAPAVDVEQLAQQMLSEPPPSALDLARAGSTPPTAKYDNYLPPELRIQEFASRHLDVPSSEQALQNVLESRA